MTVNKPFLHANRGNTGLIFALSAVPLILGAGAAIDMVRFNQTHATVQNATDAAALAGISGRTLTDAEVENVALEYITANGVLTSLDGAPVISAHRDPATGTFKVRIQGGVKTTLMALMGRDSMALDVQSETAIGSSLLEVALVLDNTGSMADEGRMTALKSVSRKMVQDIFSNRPSGSTVRIGLVPFSHYVNVGMANRNQPWISVPPDSTGSGSCIADLSSPLPVGCSWAKGTYTSDGNVLTFDYAKCATTDMHLCVNLEWSNSWHGCVGSRSGGLDTSVGSTAVRYDGLLGIGCSSEIVDLTDDEAVVTAAIDAMGTYGETYVAPGLLWGWNVLTPEAPFSAAATDSVRAAQSGSRALVLMTDGENTRSPSYPYHDGSDRAVADSKTKTLCENIKAEGITVYTVAFKVSDSNNLAMLRDCASSPDAAFDASDDAGLAAAFESIGNTLSAARIVH
jgi:Flp pilus assembly protein TadG